MIKSKDGAVEVKGSTTVLMTDLSMIIKLLRETFEEERSMKMDRRKFPERKK